MADNFPTALQRTSDERWVSLEFVAWDDSRGVARVIEAPDHAAVVQNAPPPQYESRLQALLTSPPPDPGRGVHMSWPVDLLHDLDGHVVGYLARRHRSGKTWPLADFVQPERRASIAPMSTRRHLLRVAKNVAAAAAALHHAGHANIHGRQFRVDDRADIVVVAIDELLPAVGSHRIGEDEGRLANLMVRLLGGHPWPADGGLAALLRAAGAESAATSVPAQEWFHAIRGAEKALDGSPVVDAAEAAASTSPALRSPALRSPAVPSPAAHSPAAQDPAAQSSRGSAIALPALVPATSS